MELWFMGQGYEDHLVTPDDAIPDVDKVQWKKIDAQLCSVLWQSVDPKILNKYRLTSSLWCFIGLHLDLESVQDQILVSPSVPSLDDVFARLLRLSSTQTLSTDGPSDSSVLASQTNSRGGRSGNRGRGQRPQCTYCNKLGHTQDRCYQLHGRPPRTAHIAQSTDPLLSRLASAASSTSQSITLTSSDYDAYLRYQAATSVSVASIAQTGNVSVCSTQTPSLGQWILDFGASDHILDRSTGKTIGIGRESQGLYHFTSPSFPTTCISTDAPLLIHSRLGHPSLSKFQKMDKLSAKATKCIFLGYFRLQKGYRCYSPDTHRYFLSVDVTFFEDSPFFSFSESLPISEVLSLPYISPPSDALSRSLQVYHRRHRVVAPPLSSTEVPDDSPPVPPISPTPALSSAYHLPIVLRKGNRSTRNPHPIYNFLSYHRLSSSYSAFVSTLSSVSLPKSTSAALSHPEWRQAMVDEMAVLHSNGTWDLVSLPPGYTQIYCCEDGNTFSPVAKIASVRLFLSMATMCHWALYQLDIKNVFLHGELFEEVYMEQPPDFVAQEESGLVCKLRHSLYGLKQSPQAWFGCLSLVVQEFGMLRSEADHSVFYHHNSSIQCIYLVVYVDDIVITGSDQEGIQRLKQHLFNHFQTKDLGKLKYFLGLEIAQSSSGVVMSQRKYALDILEEIGMLECKPVDTPIDPNVKLVPGQGEPLRDLGDIDDL
ncbi:Retrovirus-related Pol polyprotein from transposon RE1 [Vitis vinifera]|uniref:Retrovirus-related Pol polyprotein from transposon RE1 n=1 Tax=Vitis vinifera TaxID=29760 RepID=A0A438F9V1_VITVI|nr:Retrovirus-related Pol polyprotein from transposon RE1 [Vitis vinifera]